MPDLNIDVNYREHPKTRRLVGMLGKDAEFAPVKLWLYAGKIHPDTGKLKGYSAQEIESLVDWHGTPGAFIEAMEKLDCLKKDSLGNYAIVGWKEHQGHLVAFKVRGKIAAKARWGKAMQVMPQACNKHATSIPKVNTSNAPTDGTNGTNVEEKEREVSGGGGFEIEPPPGFPANEHDAAAHAGFVGCPEKFAVEVWNETVGRGYRDRQGHAVRSFRNYLSACAGRRSEFDRKQARATAHVAVAKASESSLQKSALPKPKAKVL